MINTNRLQIDIMQRKITPEYKATVMQAYAEGKKIQFMANMGRFGIQWIDDDNPGWHWEITIYRIKPEVEE